MITVKFLGGAKKSFSADKIEIEKKTLTIQELLNFLIKNKPENNTKLDVNNLLVAVNGIDSSAIDGPLTKLKEGDVISIIPIIHGGTFSRTQFKISNSYIELLDIKPSRKLNINFLDDLRQRFSNLRIQAITSNYLLGKSHAQKIITISLIAKQNKTLLSKKIETDILLRFAGTTQIDEAIKRVGIKSGNGFVLVAIGNKNSLDKLFLYSKPILNSNPFSQNNKNFLRKKFNITKKQINATESKSPLEDLLAEKAAILI